MSDVIETGTGLIDQFDMEAQEEAQRQALAQAALEQEAEVRVWEKRYDDARKFDSHARRQYAVDRTYVGGTAGRGNFDVRVNIAGTYVDILTAFLYAKDPAIDAIPAKTCGPSRIEMARQLSKTLEIVVTNLWENGRLKNAARPQVRSGLSIGIGWIKAAWHERMGQDPTTATKISDLQDNLRRLQSYQAEEAAGTAEDPDALRAAIEAQITALQANVEVAVSRGLVVDFISAEDIQVAPELAILENVLDAPWIAHRTFMTVEEAKEAFPDLAEEIKNASVYQQLTPRTARDANDDSANLTDRDADSYVSTESAASADGPASVCVIETWVKTENRVLTRIEGIRNKWARAPYAPQATSRFYPFFQWAPIQVDGRRHPESLPSRSVELLDEYNRTRSNKREHRKRAIPKLGFNKRAVDPDQAKALEAGAIGEMVGLDVLGEDPKSVLFPIEYNRIDPALYDTSEIRAELEMLWGIQEALSSTIRTAKTLGEAEIQQTGTMAREGHKRDSYEEMLTDLANYTAEIALARLDVQDVQAIAGPEAFWPNADGESLSVEDLAMLVAVQIRAGSTGKPNTRLLQQQWTEAMPVLREAIMHIAQLRQASPLDVADCIEELVVEYLDRMGDRIDPARFLPKQGQPVPLVDPATGMTVLAFPAPNQPAPPGDAAATAQPIAPEPATAPGVANIQE